MGQLYNYRDNNPDNQPESLQKNALEVALEKASVEAGLRPQFFRLLMESTVCLPGVTTNVATTATVCSSDSNELELQRWEKHDGTLVVPFFSSPAALRQVMGAQAPFLVMSVRALFEFTQGEILYLNAKLPQGKEFTPQEITRLLNGDNNLLSEQEILQGGGRLLLSELKTQPEYIISPLISLFSTLKTVKRAFICEVKEPSQKEGNLLIGIEADGDIEQIIQAAGSAATEAMDDDEAVDICQVYADDSGISHFMIAHIPPFYQRRWGSFLRDFQSRII